MTLIVAPPGNQPGNRAGNRPVSLEQRTQTLSSDATVARACGRHKLNSLADFRDVALERGPSGGLRRTANGRAPSGKEFGRGKTRPGEESGRVFDDLGTAHKRERNTLLFHEEEQNRGSYQEFRALAT